MYICCEITTYILQQSHFAARTYKIHTCTPKCFQLVGRNHDGIDRYPVSLVYRSDPERYKYSYTDKAMGDPKAPLILDLTLTKGSVHIAVQRGFVDFVLHNPVAARFQQWVNDTWIPDETFFSSLNHSPQQKVPGSYLGKSVHYNYSSLLSTTVHSKRCLDLILVSLSITTILLFSQPPVHSKRCLDVILVSLIVS